jgi:hypothetical protein
MKIASVKKSLKDLTMGKHANITFYKDHGNLLALR